MVPKIRNFIAGKWVAPLSGAYGDSINPANVIEVVARYPQSDEEDVDLAVAAARDAYGSWRLTPAPRRGEILYRAAALLLEQKEELARLVSREMGKVMAEEGRRLVGETVPSELADKDCKTIRVPHGVFALITPWNFPIAIPVWKIFAALICGNTVVLKPCSDTPLCAARLMEVLEKAGLPPGVANLVMGPGESVGEKLALHPEVNGISFTGSCAIGLKLERHV